MNFATGILPSAEITIIKLRSSSDLTAVGILGWPFSDPDFHVFNKIPSSTAGASPNCTSNRRLRNSSSTSVNRADKRLSLKIADSNVARNLPQPRIAARQKGYDPFEADILSRIGRNPATCGRGVTNAETLNSYSWHVAARGTRRKDAKRHHAERNS